MSENRPDGWIDVAERLPAPYASVLTTNCSRYDAPQVLYYVPNSTSVNKFTGKIYHWKSETCCEQSYDDVKFWMPIPQPPSKP
jgi:hypothetical protein